MQMQQKNGDMFVTVTGDVNVIRREHFLTMKDGAIVSNSAILMVYRY